MGIFDRLRPSKSRAPEVIPILEPPRWNAANMACRRLTDIGSPSVVPWVAFGIDHPAMVQVLPATWLDETGLTLAELESEAVRNLRRMKHGWARFDAPGPLLIATGQHVASRVVDEHFMAEAQERLKSELLLVSMPERGMLVAAGRGFPMDGLMSATTRAFARAHGPEPVTPAIFLMEGTRVFAAPRDPIETGADGPSDAADVVCTRVVTRDEDTGLEAVDLRVEHAPSAGAALACLQRDAATTWEQQQYNPAFGGRIRCWIAPSVPGHEQADVERLSTDLETSLRRVRAKTIGGHDVTISVAVGPAKGEA